MRWRATHTTSQTLTISLSLAFLVGVTARSAPKEFDGLTPAQVFERLEGAIAAEPAARLRRFIGQRVEFEGDDGLGSTPANVRVRVSGINCQVYLSQAEIKEFPPTRQYNTFSPSGPLYPGFRVVGTVRLINKQKKIVEIQSISTKRIFFNTQ
jgi:hypothetical protein